MREQISRRAVLALGAAGVAALAGCSGGSDARAEAESGAGQSGGAAGGGSGDDGSSSDGSESSDPGLPMREPSVSIDRELSAFDEAALSGGVGKDGIPSIDDPSFAGTDWGNEFMDPADPVFGVIIDGEARAYPQKILVRHEIVNDQFGDRGIAVTYCPLTGTAIGFERGSVEFGVSGMLVNSNLIMYDRATDSWWPQVLGTSILGEHKGNALHEVPVTWTTWERWRDAHPDTGVLEDNTDRAFDYGYDPYGQYNPVGGYYDRDGTLFDTMASDNSHHTKEVFIGARSADGKVAFHKERLRDELLLGADVGGVPYLAAYHHELDSAAVYRNPDEEEFTADGQQYAGPDGDTYAATNLPLERVNAFDAMWFAWYAFYPNTVVVD